MTVTGHQQRGISTQRLFITLGESIFKLFTKNMSLYIFIFYQILYMVKCVLEAVLWVHIGFIADSCLDPDPAFDIIADPDGGSGSLFRTFTSQKVELFKLKISRTLCRYGRLVGH